MAPLVAVCVCTRGRPRMLRRCLASLCRQSADAVQLRVRLILVDNGPELTMQPIFEEAWSGREDGRLVHCPRPGIPMARNAALEAALLEGADYIAFLDDDEVAPPGWLASLMRALDETGADAVQGGVRQLAPADLDLELASDSTAPIDNHPDALSCEACESLATCNVLFKARLVRPPLSLRFDEAMQFTGGSDREFFMRAHKRRARLLRVYGIDVLEEVAAGRETLRYRATRAYATGSNYYTRLLKNEPRAVAAARIALRALDRLVNGLARLASAGVLLLALRPRAAQRQWSDACASLAFAAGCVTPVAGVRAYPYRSIKGA